ncbi:hypothetical protein Tco_1434669 [Tanacetum coccineum]
MTDAQVNQEKEEVHVTFTTELPVVQQQSSSVSSDLVSKFMNPTLYTGIDSILNPNIQSDIPVNVSVSATTTTPSSDITIPLTPIPIIQPQQQTHDSTTTTTIPATTLPNIPNFASLFAASLSEFKLKKILIDKIDENKSMNRSDVQKNLYNALIESYNSDKYLFASYGDVKEIRQGRVIKRSNSKESKSTSSSKGATRSQPKSPGKSAQAEEHGPKVDDLEELSHQEFETGNDDVSPARKTIDDRPPQSWMTRLAQDLGIQSSFNEFLATPIDFSAFILNRLKINNLTQDVLTGLNYNLMKGTCKSVVELEYHLEEVFKATHDQLDWHNPEGRSYPHDLSKPLPLIQNAQGRQVISFDHLINNDLEYLKGGSLSQRYTTSITVTPPFYI